MDKEDEFSESEYAEEYLKSFNEFREAQLNHYSDKMKQILSEMEAEQEDKDRLEREYMNEIADIKEKTVDLARTIYEEQGFVEFIKDSYDTFLENVKRMIENEEMIIDMSKKKDGSKIMYINFSDVRITSPKIDRKTKLYPYMTRSNPNLKYAVSVTCSIQIVVEEINTYYDEDDDEYVKEAETIREEYIEDVDMCKIPLMLGTKYCYTHPDKLNRDLKVIVEGDVTERALNKKEIAEAKRKGTTTINVPKRIEDIYEGTNDSFGYFIVDGAKKVIINQEKERHNSIFIIDGSEQKKMTKKEIIESIGLKKPKTLIARLTSFIPSIGDQRKSNVTLTINYQIVNIKALEKSKNVSTKSKIKLYTVKFPFFIKKEEKEEEVQGNIELSSKINIKEVNFASIFRMFYLIYTPIEEWSNEDKISTSSLETEKKIHEMIDKIVKSESTRKLIKDELNYTIDEMKTTDDFTFMNDLRNNTNYAWKGPKKETEDEFADNIADFVEIVLDEIDSNFFPHMNILYDKVNEENIDVTDNKLFLLTNMVVKLIRTYKGQRDKVDRDSYFQKIIETAGTSMLFLFRVLFRKYISDATTIINKKYSGTSTNLNMIIDNIIQRNSRNGIFKSKTITDRFEYSIKNGVWGLKESKNARLDVSQALDTMSLQAQLSHIRRIGVMIDAKSVLTKPRAVAFSQLGFTCPFETPESKTCGLNKNFTSFSISSIEKLDESSEILEKIIKILEQIRYEGDKADMPVYFNGIMVDYGNRNAYLNFRRFKRIHKYFSVVIIPEKDEDYTVNEIHCSILRDRPMMPVQVVKNNQLQIDRKNMRGESLTELISSGVIEYIDPMEAEYSSICTRVELLGKDGNDYDYCVISPDFFISLSSKAIAFVSNNPTPRISYSTNMQRQPSGIYNTSYFDQFDTGATIAHYPQKSIVPTSMHEFMGLNEYPHATNVVIAVMTDGGYNIEDAIIMNKASVDRGLFRSSTFTVYNANGKNVPIGVPDVILDSREGYKFEKMIDGVIAEQDPDILEEIEMFEEGELSVQEIFEKEFIRSEKGETAVRSARTFVKPGDNLIARVRADKEEAKDVTENIDHTGSQAGFVDRVYTQKSNGITSYARVKIRVENIPTVGDKFASMYSQKGVNGEMRAPHDMPFSEISGQVPDLIINVAAFPSRMTIGQILETLLGKAKTVCRNDKAPLQLTVEELIRIKELGRTDYDTGEEISKKLYKDLDFKIPLVLLPEYIRKEIRRYMIKKTRDDTIKERFVLKPEKILNIMKKYSKEEQINSVWFYEDLNDDLRIRLLTGYEETDYDDRIMDLFDRFRENHELKKRHIQEIYEYFDGMKNSSQLRKSFDKLIDLANSILDLEYKIEELIDIDEEQTVIDNEKAKMKIFIDKFNKIFDREILERKIKITGVDKFFELKVNRFNIKTDIEDLMPSSQYQRERTASEREEKVAREIGDSFYVFDKKLVEEELLSKGYERTGYEMMIDGRTGEPLDAEIFMGVCTYQELKHKVRQKAYSRNIGRKDEKLQQPTSGKKRGGGGKIGEMERRNLISHGGAGLIRSLTLESSDATKATICQQCNSFCSYNFKSGNMVCPQCANPSSAGYVTVPYVNKLVTQEMGGMGIELKYQIRDKIQTESDKDIAMREKEEMSMLTKKRDMNREKNRTRVMKEKPKIASRPTEESTRNVRGRKQQTGKGEKRGKL